MNNNNNKKTKRVLPLLLAILLLISAGAYGTRAFFTDEEKLLTSIEITTGSIDIEAPEKINWEYTPSDTSNLPDEYVINSQLKINGQLVPDLAINTDLGSEILILNARPGDAFTMDIEVENRSTLDMLISDDLTEATFNGGLYTFEFTNKFGDLEAKSIDENEDNTLIKAGETLTYHFKVAVNVDANSTTYNNINLNELTKFAFKNITLNVKQPNAN